MCDTQKAMGLLTQVTRGLLKHAQKQTERQLGNRSEYIGMSDIGSGVECLRKAVANKVYGNPAPTIDDLRHLHQDQNYKQIRRVLSKQLSLQRGHWFEAGILDALYANTGNLFSQLEIEVEVDGVPVKAHLDFVLVAGGDTPTVRILELKSTEHLPEHLYSAYEIQLYGQLGLLAEFWHQPCFNLKSDNGENMFSNLTFPDMVQQAFGLELPGDVSKVDLEGWVLALSMKDAKAFGPYVASDMMTSVCKQTAQSIWENSDAVKQGTVNLDSIEYCHGFHPLCDYCDHKENCPKFKAIELADPGYNELLADIDKLKLNKKQLESDISVNEGLIRDFYLQCNVRAQWLDAGDYKFRCTEIAPRKTLDKDILKDELVEVLGEEDANKIIDRCTKVGAPSNRLYLSKNKGK